MRCLAGTIACEDKDIPSADSTSTSTSTSTCWQMHHHRYSSRIRSFSFHRFPTFLQGVQTIVSVLAAAFSTHVSFVALPCLPIANPYHYFVAKMHTQSIVHTALIDLDLLTFIIALLLTGLSHSIISGNQTIRPFYPHDATLWETFTKDTIHTSTLFILHYFILSPVIYFLELKNLCTASLSPRQRRLFALRLAFGMWTATMVAIVAIELGKGYVGRLRPHFATTCLGPLPYTQEVLSKVILTDADCPTPHKQALHDARRSFPSGHAALGVGGAAYAQLCLTRFAIRRDGVQSTIAMLTGWALMIFGGWVGASRVFDNAHHVSDVAIGSLVGLWTSAVQFWLIVARTSRAVAAGQEQDRKVE